MCRILLLLIYFALTSIYAKESAGLLPPGISSVSEQYNSAWEELIIELEHKLPVPTEPIITESAIEIKIPNAPGGSILFQTTTSSIVKGFAWSEGSLVIYLHHRVSPAVIIRNNIIQLQSKTAPGRLKVRKVIPTGISNLQFFLPSIEPMARNSKDFADVKKKELRETLRREMKHQATLKNSIQVKKSESSYIVTEEITSLFSQPSERSRVIEALEFGDRLKVTQKHPPFYKAKYNNKEGYVYQRDVLFEAELTTAQKDALNRLNKKAPGGVDSVAKKLGWKNDDRIVYSSFGHRDPFIEVKNLISDGINIDQLSLVGVVYENVRPMAVFSDTKNSKRSYTLYEGDSIQNGKILKISQNSVLFLLNEFGVSRRYSMSLPDRYGGEK